MHTLKNILLSPFIFVGLSLLISVVGFVLIAFSPFLALWFVIDILESSKQLCRQQLD